MERILRRVATVLAMSTAVLVACHKIPFTNRLQFNVIPDGIMNSIGKTSYTSQLQGVSLVRGGTDNTTLRKVGEGIAKQANQPKYDWEYALIDEPTINAWCLPGGKIGFYTGILPVLKNEAGMAFVMGHEVGHAVARHGSERMSQQFALIGGLAGLEIYLGSQKKLTPAQQAAVLGAIGLGAEVGVILPFSRAHESEADIIGLMYMAGAGYPPEESIKVWDRMGAATGGRAPPPFLSTHPTNEARQRNLSEWMDNARKRYDRGKLGRDTLETLW